METGFQKIAFILLSFIVICGFAGQIIKTNEYKYIHRTWPELQGKTIDEVATTILNQFPNLRIKVRSAKYGITPEVEPNIVLLYRNESGEVLNRPEAVERIPIEVKSWPEVVGLTADEAKEIILKEKPNAEIEIVQEGSAVTLDRQIDRCRIFVNSDDVVVEAPQTG